MRYMTLANTDIKISRVSFGTSSLHHVYSRKGRHKLLRAAHDLGISHFDTSPYYGYGLAEQDLGSFLQGHRIDVTITTKVGLYPPGRQACGVKEMWIRKGFGRLLPPLSLPIIDWSVKTAARSLESSLKRLKTDYVDFLFLHEPDLELIDTEEFLSWLTAEKANGKIRYWGMAGLFSSMATLIQTGHPLGLVLQVKDSLEQCGTEGLAMNGRELQFTYGYYSTKKNAAYGKIRQNILQEALRRNRTGSVLYSTRRLDRLAELRHLQIP